MVVVMNDHRIGPSERSRIAEAVERARSALLADQRPDGHWCFELEADS